MKRIINSHHFIRYIASMILLGFIVTNITYEVQAITSITEEICDINSSINYENINRSIYANGLAAYELNENEPEVVAESAVLIEVETGAVLYDKNCHERLYPASITKIMTALLTLENTSMDETLVFTDEIVNSIPYDASKMGAVDGEEISIKDAMYALMLKSCNDVAAGLGYHVSGSEVEFAKKMTDRAKEIGAVNTNFMNATGLHHDEHYTTAYDMALITREAMSNHMFAEISGTLTYRILPTNKYEYRRTLNNSHELLSTSDEDFYSYAIAGKTGYTSAAGRTLVTVAKKNDVTLICVVLKSTRDSAGKDTKAILEYGFNNYNKTTIRESEKDVDKSFFSEMSQAFVSPQSAIYIDKDTSIMMPQGVDFSELTKKTEYFKETSRGIIGELQYYYENKLMGKADIKLGVMGAENSLDNNGAQDGSGSTGDKFENDNTISINVWLIVLGVVIIVIIIIFIAYLVKTREKRRRKKERKRIFKESRKRFKNRRKYR